MYMKKSNTKSSYEYAVNDGSVVDSPSSNEAKYFSMDINRQLSILKNCIESNKPLASGLKSHNLTYDNLQYQISHRPKLIDSRCYTLSDFTQPANGIPVVSLFSGAGGLDLGFEAAGFSHSLLVEKNNLFCETLKLNRPQWKVEPGDVSDTDSMIGLLSKQIGCTDMFEGVFIGGPPCQPFSIASNQRFNKNGENFKRTGFAHVTNGNLLFKYIELIKHFKPRVFLIENVPGLIDVDGGEQLEHAYRELEKSGYQTHDPLILKANHHYVPQQRTRLFIVGSRINKDFNPPKPTPRSLSVGPVFELPLDGVANHVTRHHSAESIMRYMMLDYGNRDKLGRVDRLDPLVASKTVIAGGSSGGGRSHLHPYIPRTISVRECARIQTFPDQYVFTGPVARQFTQVGNAVPPILGAQMAQAIYKSFYS